MIRMGGAEAFTLSMEKVIPDDRQLDAAFARQPGTLAKLVKNQTAAEEAHA